MEARTLRTQVGIIGAGPAGLVLANLLTAAGIDCVVLERHSRARVERRARAGLVEQRTVRLLRDHGLAGRLLSDGSPHGWCDFLCLGRVIRLDYAALSGARHWVYPQQLLVRDLLASLDAAGRPPLFECSAVAVEDIHGPRATIRCEDGPTVVCDHVVGADGPQGLSRAALSPAATPYRRRYPYDWLAILAEVDRPVPGVVYGLHADGFAGMMPRSPRLARFYLQCPPGDTPAAWPAPRILAALRRRLNGAHLPRIGALTETRMLRMRADVTEPMARGRLLLAGDAAHVLTPSGAKGMNLAIADAADLADALTRGPAALEGYSARRLPDVWRTQEFSDRLLGLLHLPAGSENAADPRFGLRLRLATLERLAVPGPFSVAFAHAYAGSGEEPVSPAGPR
ncbi:FAD-dependent monooxygenase [Streptomyces sp. MS19]|uniref:FAD-dependent monooxygenase n=1 Tax=Streptomyces sp. MS19 TaxID=3385972 RepID=UPI0039A3380B